MTETKIIGYAYPGSPMANKINRGKGCFYVGRKKTPMSNPDCIFAFNSFEEAKFEADKLPQPYNKYSLQTDEARPKPQGEDLRQMAFKLQPRLGKGLS